MRRFRWIVTIATAVSELPFILAAAWALGHVIAAWIAWSISIAIGLGAFAVLPFRLALLLRDRPISATRRVFERLYYAHWGGSLFALLLSVVLFPLLALSGISSVGGAAACAYAMALALAMYATFIRPVWTRVRELDVEVRDLPQAFDGYRIAHLSDLHVGSLCPASRAERWVRITNRLDVDAVALTGDYVTTGTLFHEVTARVLSSLAARDGVFAVLGNHDDYGGGEPLRSGLRAGGIRLLRNERAIISRGDVSLTIAGVDDTFTRHADVEMTFAGLDEGATVVALAHDPALFKQLSKRGVALQLSGHTHWGQIGLPFFEERINFAARFYRYHSGMLREGDSTLYIHPGLGMTGPPLRLGAPPEITVLRLRSLGRAQE